MERRRAGRKVGRSVPHALTLSIIAVGLSACTVTKEPMTPDQVWSRAEEQRRQFGDFELPVRLGTVENVGLQVPAVSPSGQELLYLRTDMVGVSPLTILGSSESTPEQGTLSIWLRELSGHGPGRRVSPQRWAHSPVWSPSGRAVAFVANEPPYSAVMHLDLESGQGTKMGLAGAVNCLPRFDGGDHTLLFCAQTASAPGFRIFRQSVGETQAEVLSPARMNCVLPAISSGAGQVICARADGEYLHWTRASEEQVTDLFRGSSQADPRSMLQTWAGISAPLSPSRRSLLFFNTLQDKIGVLDLEAGRALHHLAGSHAACWVNEETIALATGSGVFLADTVTGSLVPLLSGRWVPCRYVASERRLVLLGEGERRGYVTIWEVVFRARSKQSREAG